MPEHVEMEEALELLKKPRLGSVILAFKRAKFMPEVIHEGPHSKKKKEEKEHEGNPFYKLVYSTTGHHRSG
jgi:hypothetical protein